MHALASPIVASTPRVWLLTRDIDAPAPAPRRSVAAGAITTAALFLFVFATFAGMGALTVRGVQVFLIQGAGLEPAVPAGALIMVDPLADRTASVGQLIAFRETEAGPSAAHVTETIVSTQGIEYVTAVPTSDQPRSVIVRDEDVLGSVVLYLPGAQSALEILEQPTSRTLALVLAVVVLCWRALALVPHRQSRSKPRQALSIS